MAELVQGQPASSGVVTTETKQKDGAPTGGNVSRWAVFLHSCFFVLGFTLVFTLLGSAAGFLGRSLNEYMDLLQKLGALLLVVFAFATMGVFRYLVRIISERVDLKTNPAAEALVSVIDFPNKLLYTEKRVGNMHQVNRSWGYLSSMGIGIAFAAGWVPCIGPILASILFLAGDSQTVWQGAVVLAVLFTASGLLGWFWLGTRWLAPAGAFWALALLFYTTFFTNGQGIGTGLVGSLGYWMEQQKEMRGSQPWYYFFVLVPQYEFLPLVLSVGGIVYWVRTRWFHRTPPTSVEETPHNGPLPDVEGFRSPISVQALFEAFMVFWVLGTWVVFTYVGEKMAWHTAYFATTMGMLGGWALGKLICAVDWRRARRQGIFWLMAMTPLFLVALKAILPTTTRRPFADMSISGLSVTLQWALALVFGLVLLYFIYDRIVVLGWRTALQAIALSLVGLLAVWTMAVAYRFNYINYDYPTEMMVYAHGTPDIKLALGQLEEISRKTTGDHQLKFSYDDDSTWPLEWYFRDYPNKVYYAATPNRNAMDLPVVFAGDKNLTKVKPYLGDRYYEFDYRLNWWPKEDYKSTSWQRIINNQNKPTTQSKK
jgi:uncharacterized protein (TIGR03663 family)